MYHDVRIVTYPAKGGLGTDGYGYDISLYKDYYLVPTSLPIIKPPGIKTHEIDIPGANGVLDLTEVLTPYPLYQNRTGSLKFALLDDRRAIYNRYAGLSGNYNSKFKTNNRNLHEDTSSWAKIYSELMNRIHGRKCHLFLEDEPEWFYQGRLAVNSWDPSSDGGHPTVTIDYNLEPYKLSVDDVGSFEYVDNSNASLDTTEGRGLWKWDPFSFVDGIVYDSQKAADSGNNVWSASGAFKDIVVNTDSWKTYLIKDTSNGTTSNHYIKLANIGYMPVCPKITVKTYTGTSVWVKIINSELGYTGSKEYTKEFTNNGTGGTVSYIDPGLMFYDYVNNGFEIYFKGHGEVSFSFRKGSL